METAPDVVLLDPMFPVRQKSGLIKKKFQLLQKLEQPSADEEAELLQAALAASPRRIVIKRPLKGPYLAGRQPDYSLCGTAIRYDCILVGQKQSGSTAAAGFGQADSTDADAAESGQDDCTQKCRSVAKDDPLMLEYHDRRWCRPCHDDRELFAMFCLEGQQAGLSWSTIIHKEKAIREAFDGFDIRTVAGYDSGKVEELMNVPGIIRSRSKIRAAVHNAGIVCGMLSSGEYASFDEYVWHFTGGRQIIHHLHELSEMPAKNELSEEVSRDMKKRGFLFAGPVICYSYLQGIGVIDDHLDGCSCKAKPQKK
jgi:DNA-3-methyladenine glycosylase I